MAKKKFGGYKVSFKGDNTPLEKLFGSKPIAPSEMTKKLWGHIKKKKVRK